MTAHTPGFPPHGGAPSGLPPRAGFGPQADPVDATWAALEAAQAAVALLAGQQPPEAADPRMASFPAAIRRTGGWRLRLAEQGLADLAAMMEPGLAALLSVQAHGGDARPPARALLQEFAAARAALLALVR